MSRQTNLLLWFKRTALAEGVSFILLLFLAMPLKYLFGYPYAVTLVGWAHGVLFTAYLILLLQVWVIENWSFRKVLLAFVAGLVPFGPFLFERRYLNHLS